jgi:hypothetical protein
MEKDWVRIFKASSEPQVTIACQVLHENGIASVVMNKKDQSFLFGMVELYVSKEDEERAKLILKDIIGE